MDRLGMTYGQARNDRRTILITLMSGPTDSAYMFVQQVRDRAGIKTRDKAEYTQQTFRELVRNERARELCFESLRKYDLIRWGVYVTEMNNYKVWTADERWAGNSKADRALDMGTSVSQRHVLLPIPSIELGVNDLLVQNPLW